MSELDTSPYEEGGCKGNKLDAEGHRAAPGEGGASSGRRWRGWAKGGRRAGLVLLIFLLGSIPFWIWPLDLELSGRFYSPERGWFHQWMPFWEFLYEFGTLPSVLLVAAALVIYAAGWPLVRWRRFRRVVGYLILCMAIGPGLIINLCLKSEWGRPRPRAVEQFGGRYAFEPVLTMDPESPGQSFPCGHCSMGFYLFALAMLAGWRTRAGLATGAGAAVFGLLIGMARVVQGGHFASDVWWAAGLCLATSVWLFHGLGLDQSLWHEEGAGAAEQKRKLPLWLGVVLALGGVVLAGAVLLATPYRCREIYRLELAEERSFRLMLWLEGDRHELVSGDGLRIEVRGSGHGVPGSAVKSQLTERRGYEEDRGGVVDLFQFRQRFSGWFREVDHETQVVLPWDRPGRVDMEVRSGQVWLEGVPPDVAQEWRFRFPGGHGRVHLGAGLAGALHPGGKVKVKIEGGELVKDPGISAARKP